LKARPSPSKHDVEWGEKIGEHGGEVGNRTRPCVQTNGGTDS